MKKDWILFTDIVLILLVGLTTLYSTVIGEENIILGGGIFNKQLIFVVVGIALYFAISFMNYKILKYPQLFVILYFLTAISLILLLLFGVEINRSKRWFLLFGVQFQVSEVAKLVVIISTVGLMSLKDRYNEYLLAGISFLATLIISVLIFFEPDASTAIVILAIWFFVMFTSLSNQLQNLGFLAVIISSAIGMVFLLSQNYIWALILIALSVIVAIVMFINLEKLRLFIIGTIVLGLLGGFLINFGWNNVLQDYQKERVESFINPEEDVQGSGFQVAQSKVAIGSGMIWGKGFGHGTQSKLNFLPEHQTDFIFAAFAEEFGLVGSLFLLSLYTFLIFRILSISRRASDSFGMLLCIGIGVKIVLEVFINIGMNLGVIPATGIPLPLMSAGGSILLVTMICLGLVQSVYLNRDEISN